MKIFNQNYAGACPSFSGRVDDSVVKRVKATEKKLINDYVQSQNRSGGVVDPNVIEEIRTRFSKVIEQFQEKAKHLFKDSVVVCNKDNRIYVVNPKLGNSSRSIIARTKYDYYDVNDFSKFKEKITDKYYEGDPIARVEYYNPHSAVEYNIQYHPQNLSEFEEMVELFRPKCMNEIMLDVNKSALLENISYKNLAKPSLKLKKLVKDIQAVEKELPPARRDTSFWTNVKNELKKNDERNKLVEQNNKYLQ